MELHIAVLKTCQKYSAEKPNIFRSISEKDKTTLLKGKMIPETFLLAGRKQF